MHRPRAGDEGEKSRDFSGGTEVCHEPPPPPRRISQETDSSFDGRRKKDCGEPAQAARSHLMAEGLVKRGLRVLLYSHNPQYVDRYLKLIKKARKNLQVFACRNTTDISRNIGKADIIFSGHTFPVEFIDRANRLRWIQSMSAGVENFVRSEFVPSRVQLTRVEGVFGPIMSEYIIGYIVAVAPTLNAG